MPHCIFHQQFPYPREGCTEIRCLFCSLTALAVPTTDMSLLGRPCFWLHCLTKSIGMPVVCDVDGLTCIWPGLPAAARTTCVEPLHLPNRVWGEKSSTDHFVPSGVDALKVEG